MMMGSPVKMYKLSILLLIVLLLQQGEHLVQAQTKGFANSGELRVAVEQYLTNESEAVIPVYGMISDWNVSLVDDMSGT